jgi:hypothetical protein
MQQRLVRAKSATYVGGGAHSLARRPGSHDLEFHNGDFAYLDTYYGGTDFIGEEAVYFEGQPVWAMNYLENNMDFDISQTSFDNLGQWHAWRLGLDLAQPRPEANADELIFQHFLRDFLADLYANPAAYSIPHVAYEPTLPGDEAREERLREGRLKVRRASEIGLLDFLYQLGQVGDMNGDSLRVARVFFEQLVAEKVKKVKVKGLPQSFERIGMSFAVGDDVQMGNARYPGLMEALAAFAKSCAAIPEYGFYFFRRGDFAIYDGKRLPLFEDGLRLLSDELADQVQRADTLLAERKFKRELFTADGGDAGYRMRYLKKKGNIAYWSRIRAWSSLEHDHNLRWDFDSDLTPRLFERLDAAHPGLAGQLFAGIKRCAHCYENCIVRKVITYQGQTQEVCQEVGWQTIGESATDYENLRTVLAALDELARQEMGKKK